MLHKKKLGKDLYLKAAVKSNTMTLLGTQFIIIIYDTFTCEKFTCYFLKRRFGVSSNAIRKKSTIFLDEMSRQL